MVDQLESREVPAAISGLAFYDANADGIQDNNESTAMGIAVSCTPTGGSGNTDSFGFYSFTGLASGTYTVTFTAPTGYHFNTPVGGSQMVALGTSDETVNAGLVLDGGSPPIFQPPISPPPPITPPPVYPPPNADPSAVYVWVTAQDASELGPDGNFLFFRSGDTSGTLTAYYAVGGVATPGDDYTPLSGVVEFEAGQSTSLVPLHGIDDWVWEDDESVTVTVQDGPGYSHNNLETTALLLDGKKAPPSTPMQLPAPAAGAATPSVDYKTFRIVD